ncbi:hypothetical protein WDU94_014332 [Cyamophila willieti]
MDYDHLNYISEMTKYIVRKRMMLGELGEKLDKTSENMVISNVGHAVDKSMVFTLRGYYPIVRHTLVGLGWVEKVDPRYVDYDIPMRRDFIVTTLDSAPLIIKNETADKVKKELQKQKLVNTLLEDKNPNLFFSLRKNYITWNTIEKDTIVSYFPKCNFCSKYGLNMCLENIRLFQCSNDSLKFPRSYTMSNENSVRRFTQHFRETLCFSLMRFVKESYETNRVIKTLEGTVPWTTFDFAETTCKTRLSSLRLENVAEHPADQYKLAEPQKETQMWLDIGEYICNVTSGRSHFRYIHDMGPIYIRAKKIIESFDELAKQEIFEGAFNTWVVKPVANCSGHGIKLHRKIGDIKQAIYPLKTPSHYVRFVLQKYIERPLLIHSVKFDLRVWYLVTTLNKMKIWVYQEGYVRFCSKSHSNVSLEESRHLTNVRIQRQYRARRDPQLSPELMWDFRTLRDYFTEKMKLPNMWDKIMKAIEESIIAIMQCAMSTNLIDLRKNSFQLFGADFLIHENFQPCLIEVNNGPGLSPTTSIIAKKTTELLADITRVVNYERNPLTCIRNSVDPGNFHLIYIKDMTQPFVPSKEKVMQGMTSTPVNLKEWKNIARKRRAGSRLN